MITLEQYTQSVCHEMSVIRHLYGKVPVSARNLRLAPNGRSTLELLRYLSVCGIGPAKALVKSDWNLAREVIAASATLEWDDIPAALNTQERELKALLSTLKTSDLSNNTVYPWGETTTLGPALVNTVLKFLTAYRMELFWHAKAGGAQITTPNCWRGTDAAMPAKS
ncbi:MAG: hypothetical protein AB7F75_03615 [Planctomycetota bacterium]